MKKYCSASFSAWVKKIVNQQAYATFSHKFRDFMEIKIRSVPNSSTKKNLWTWIKNDESQDTKIQKKTLKSVSA